MKNTRVALRYAKSLFCLADEQQKLDHCRLDMDILIATCESSRELVLLLKSPIVKTDKKQAILGEIFSKLSSLSQHFIRVVTNKKREYLLKEIAEAFLFLYKERKEIRSAVVTTAAPLDEELRKDVLSFIKKQGEGEIELDERVDENLIGGAIIRLGDKQLDASVLRQINDLKQIFNKNLYIQDF